MISTNQKKLLCNLNTLLIRLSIECDNSQDFNSELGKLNIFTRSIDDISTDIFNYITEYKKQVLLESLKRINEEEDIANLGFNCLGMLCEKLPSYKYAYERHWLWEDNDGLKVITYDSGNGYCGFLSTLDDYRKVVGFKIVKLPSKYIALQYHYKDRIKAVTINRSNISNKNHKVWCPFCKGSGFNEATNRLHDAWLNYLWPYEKEGWRYNLEQEEVQALLDAGRLPELTSNGHIPTAEEVNTWARKGIGHDSLNRFICVQTRAKRLGIYGECLHCHGTGEI